jgi:hypothetical protein
MVLLGLESGYHDDDEILVHFMLLLHRKMSSCVGQYAGYAGEGAIIQILLDNTDNLLVRSHSRRNALCLNVPQLG